MLDLAGSTARRPDRTFADALRGAAILALCFVLATTFLADVWRGPAAPRASAEPTAATPTACAGQC